MRDGGWAATVGTRRWNDRERLIELTPRPIQVSACAGRDEAMRPAVRHVRLSTQRRMHESGHGAHESADPSEAREAGSCVNF